MIKFIPLLLLWIFSLYLTSWIHTNLRAESVLINTGKKLNKVLFFINPSGGISIVSIISGLFAHFSLFIFIALLIFLNNETSTYMELITTTWIWMGFSLLSAGETIETYIKFKKAETRKERREFLELTVILSCTVAAIFYFTIKYGMVLCKVIFA